MFYILFMQDNNILAVVLAGGKSKRFGEDKNYIKLGDKTLLEHVLSKISEKFAGDTYCLKSYYRNKKEEKYNYNSRLF